MARLAGDPGPFRWMLFAIGFRLPDDYTDWVRHELTDAGWRLRTVFRHLAVIVPICVILAIVLLTWLPAPGWLAAMMVGLILAGSVFTVTAYADDIRASRLRQHGLEAPDDPDLGRPAH
jgi:archaellum biogenesis protein FlaJ (TadC family)